MKSRISIDVDYDNQPIIKIEYCPSEDVRDKLVKKFMETFGGKSYFATFFYDDSPFSEIANRSAKIRPLPTLEFLHHVQYMQAVGEEERKSAIVQTDGSDPAVRHTEIATGVESTKQD